MSQVARSVVTVLCVLLAAAAPSGAEDKVPPPTSPGRTSTPAQPTISPLHAFLGIDPVTGEFKPPRPQRPRMPAATAAKPAPPATSFETDNSPSDLPLGATDVEDLRTAVVRALENGDDQALAAALLKLPQGAGNEWLTSGTGRYLQWGCLILLFYPLGVVFAELFAAWRRRDTNGRCEQDRRFYTRQLRRSALLTACTAAGIGLLWWAGENDFWWSQPTRLIVAGGTVTVLLLGAAALRVINRRAASRYSLATIEDLRRQQLTLQREIVELRKCVQKLRGPETFWSDAANLS